MDKITDLYNHQLRYYPVGNKGDIDEWGAVEKHRQEVLKKEEDDARIQAAINKRQYANELEMEIAQKRQLDALEGNIKAQDKNYLEQSQ